MKTSNNSKILLFSQLVVIVSMGFFLSSCVNTQDAKESSELININNRLETLLIQAGAIASNEGKPFLANFAKEAETKADQLVVQQRLILALGFYQAASQAYWRDDIAMNNASIFEIAATVEQICQELGVKAPDRDCFVSPLIERLASVDMITYNSNMILQGTNVSPSMAQSSRDLLFDLGKKNNTEVSGANGALTNLINYAALHQSLLLKHSDLNSYVCSNLVGVFDAYVYGLFALEDYYQKGNNTEAIEQLKALAADHPLYAIYNKSVNLEDTRRIRAAKFIKSQVPSCAS